MTSFATVLRKNHFKLHKDQRNQKTDFKEFIKYDDNNSGYHSPNTFGSRSKD